MSIADEIREIAFNHGPLTDISELHALADRIEAVAREMQQRRAFADEIDWDDADRWAAELMGDGQVGGDAPTSGTTDGAPVSQRLVIFSRAMCFSRELSHYIRVPRLRARGRWGR